MGREILITPNRSTTGSTLEPTISFSGATNGTINLKVEDDGSLVFEGVNGGLFNITDSKNGLLHSVNDVSGLPILSVYSDDRVIAGAYNQNALVVNSDKVGIGIPNPSEKLEVSGKTKTTTLQVTSGATIGYVLTSDSDGNATWQAPTVFTGNTSASCITDLYVSNIHSCSPLNINPLDEGNIYFGSTSSLTFDVTNKRLGLNQPNPQYTFDFKSKDGNTLFYYNDVIPSTQNIVISGNSSVLTSMVVASRLSSVPATIGLNVGLVGENSTLYPGYGNPLDAFIYASSDTNRLNIVSAPRTLVGANTDDIRFYAGQFVNSGFGSDMHIQGRSSGGSIRGYVGIGTEVPQSKLDVNGKTRTSELQVTTSPVNGYVLTSDVNGNATWQAPTGGGSGTTIVQFTGNTSATCITDLYVTNVHGCSPITVWDSVQSNGSQATGVTSFAFGYQTQALGDYSHAEGFSTIAIGTASHAEGTGAVSIGASSHAEGSGTIAIGFANHAEGENTVTVGNINHVEGSSSRASGTTNHAEGASTIAIGFANHAEGFGTLASGITNHAEGRSTEAIGEASHAEGYYSVASGRTSHAEGWYTRSIGNHSHSEGFETFARGLYSHSEGFRTTASNDASHAEGYQTTASGLGSHAEGVNTVASGAGSHAGGSTTTASGTTSFVHGVSSIAAGNSTIVLGNNIIGAINNTTYVETLSLKTVRNYINDAAADADTTLASGGLYTLTGSRTVYRKP